MPASRRQLLRLLEKLGVRVTEAVIENIEIILMRVSVAALERAIARGDNIESIMRAIGIRPGAWAHVTESIRQAYIDSGVFIVAADVPKRFGMTFDWTNPRAERWLREHSSQLVTRISNEQRDAIREVLNAGMRAGKNPRSVALDIVGRVSRQTGKRAGGIVGLTQQQTQYVLNARDDLENLSSNYFTRKRRDRRFDSLVRRHIESGTPLTQPDINRIVGRYEDRLLQLRGETIGRTEALSSLNQAADEALLQVIDEGLAPPDAVERIMDATMDTRTRPAHQFWDGQVRGPGDPFQSGTGALLMHPGDSSLGAGADDIVACRCVVTHKIDFVAVEQAA